MSIAERPPVGIALRELALMAWRAEQERREEARRYEIAEMRRGFREGLRGAIESTLRVQAILHDIECPLSDEEVEGRYPGQTVARTVIDGLTLALVRHTSSLHLELVWRCATCGFEPPTDTRLKSLEELGSLLAYLPTLCEQNHPKGY